MNRILLSVTPFAIACAALGQIPAAPQAARVNVTDSGKVARFLAGPSDRPEGFLLRDGTFVVVPPGLSQRMPSSIGTDTSISVTGDEFTYAGNRTIHAQRVVIAGVSYEDMVPVAPAPPPPPASAGASRPLVAPVPPPCAPAAVAPPPAPVPPTAGAPPVR